MISNFFLKDAQAARTFSKQFAQFLTKMSTETRKRKESLPHINSFLIYLYNLALITNLSLQLYKFSFKKFFWCLCTTKCLWEM